MKGFVQCKVKRKAITPFMDEIKYSTIVIVITH